tara:strand:- start:6479 stop:8173 length:1695 start_codon:yes stop_codon:yes gene_type:complete
MTGFGGKDNKKTKRKRASTQSGEISIDSILERAFNNHINGDVALAEKEYRKAIELGSKHHAVFANLGVICTNSGRIEEAVALYQKSIELNPEDANTYSNLGFLYFNLGKYKQAAELTSKSLEKNPNNAQVQTILGWSYKELGNLDQALSITLKSLELKPNNTSALINLGGIYKDLGILDQALTSTIKALEFQPDNVSGLINLAGIYQDLGRPRKALNSILKALDLEPENTSALINLANICQELGMISEARAAIFKSIHLKPINNTRSLDTLTLMLQHSIRKQNAGPRHLIEEVDIKLRKLNIEFGRKHFHVSDSINIIKEALKVAGALGENIVTNLTQIYHRKKSIEPNCNKLMDFFNMKNAIAQRCHSCYKVQIEVNSLNELINLNFLMKKIQFKSDNTSKCMIELRTFSKGHYKGIIYCSSIDEAASVLVKTKNYIEEKSDINPIFGIKRGCTEFTNKHSNYGRIGDLQNLDPGPRQLKDWAIIEEEYFKAADEVAAQPIGWEFNLGELLIIKNWVLYALALEDFEAIREFGDLSYKNHEVAALINLKMDAMKVQSSQQRNS